jgi:hypothetical protein
MVLSQQQIEQIRIDKGAHKPKYWMDLFGISGIEMNNILFRLRAGEQYVEEVEQETAQPTISMDCLVCSNPFVSWDRARNRLCDICRDLNVSSFEPDHYGDIEND